MPATAFLDCRYTFGPQFLHAAAIFAKRAKAIEAMPVDEVREHDELIAEHRGCVVSAIMQSVAAMESDGWEVIHHGPGHHLGSSEANTATSDFLLNFATNLDRLPPLEKYNSILYLLQKPTLERGRQPFQGAKLLVDLRNELTHFKSLLSEEREDTGLPERMKLLRHSAPAFLNPALMYFPHLCLSAECAEWAVVSAIKLIDVFYDKVGVASPLEGYSRVLGSRSCVVVTKRIFRERATPISLPAVGHGGRTWVIELSATER